MYVVLAFLAGNDHLTFGEGIFFSNETKTTFLFPPSLKLFSSETKITLFKRGGKTYPLPKS